MGTQKKKQVGQTQDTVLEQLRDLGGGVVKSTKSDLIGGVATGVLNELFSPKKKDLKSPEVTIPQEEFPPRPTFEIKKPREVTVFTAQEANLTQEVEAVRHELKKTAEELKELNTAVSEVEKTIEQAPVKPGKYHLSFFSKLRAILKLFRQQVSESRVWLEASFARKRKRQYWFLFKKHGTTFGLSSERVIATQAG